MQLIIQNNAYTPNNAHPEIYNELLIESSWKTPTSLKIKHTTPPIHGITIKSQRTIIVKAMDLNQPKYLTLLLGFLKIENFLTRLGITASICAAVICSEFEA